ncbi:hypothetical protein FACS1894181_02240 [Bacteroidia bacterium]|nr:hypothetical protein FACS1894181_02240 [Bacteroidia bacterium]
MVVSGEASYAPVVKQISFRIDTYKHTIAQRQAATVAKKKDNAQSVIDN